MKSVALHNLGCKVNTYELDVMRQKLHENGYSIVSFDEVADIYIVNTCSVTNIADRKSRQMLHQAKKRNPQAVVVATGCYAQTGTRQAEEDEAVDLIIGNNKKKDIVEILEQYFQDHPDKTLHGTTVIDINKTDQYEEMTLKTTTEHTRAYIKIQDGCNQFCSYCIIPYARGRVRSRQEKDILAEVENLVSAGFREIVVTGIHVSSYGMDFDGKKNPVGTEPFDYHRLLSLLQKLNSVEGLSRIRLSSLEPRIITREFAQELVKLEKLCPHFHLSLQSGCDETLQRMNRHYTTGEYLEKVKILRECFPDPAITTDVITGFPGETDEEFEKTKDFLDRVHFYEMHIFPYSKRKGTVAADRKDQVPDRIKKERSSILLEMERKQSAEYRRKWIGKTEEVLLEEQKRIGEEMYQIGHTKNYVRVAVKTDENLSEQLHTGLITGFLQEDLMLME